MKTSLKATLIAAALAALPLGAQAAGLGPINVFSGLGQPLRAEIELKATPQELQSLTARIASADAFRQANVAYSPVMSALRLAVDSRGSRPVVRITSDRPVDEPFVELLVELNWNAGRLIREYTFLLDPVELAAQAEPAPRSAGVSSPPPLGAAVRAPAPATPRAPAGARDGSTYQVARGDTLRRIAEAHRPAGVTLEQMLLALYRDNPGAFEGDNINRLKAGAVLHLPDQAAVRALDAGQARREVVAHAADFEAYRARLAGTVAARPALAEEPASRASAGTITPRVEEAPRAGASGDQVRVSGNRSDEPVPPGTAGGAALSARLQALEEELAARDRALAEAGSRIAELEKSIVEFQQLLELRNRSFAQMQEQAAQGAAPAPTPAESAAAPAPAGDAQLPAQAAPVESVAARPAEPPAAPPAPPEPPPVPGLVDSLLEDPAVLAGGGAILALLLGLAGYKVHQRRKESESERDAAGIMSELPPPNSVFGGTGGQSVDTRNSSVMQTDFSQLGMSSIDADEGVDPVAEADVYIAYGRDAQAEEILLDALKADPSRIPVYMKLLEIYAQRKDLKQFETIATDLYSRTAGEGPDWARAAEMGRALDAGNPLYSSAAGGMPEPARSETDAPRAESAFPSGPATITGAALAGAAALRRPKSDEPDEMSAAPLSALDFTASVSAPSGLPLSEALQGQGTASQYKSTWIMAAEQSSFGAEPGAVESAAPAAGDALPDIDSEALDFDLALDEEDSEPASAPLPPADAPSATPPDDEGLMFDLDIGDSSLPAASPAASEGDVPAAAQTLTFAEEPAPAADWPQMLDEMSPAPAEPEPAIELFAPEPSAGADEPLNFAAGDTALTPPPASADSATADLEQTTFDDSLLDFDFDLETAAPVDASALDLSAIDLELEAPLEESAPPQAAKEASGTTPAAAQALPLEDEGLGGFDLDAEDSHEIDTKLELAHAYEEMGDSEGARELLEEVMRDGAPEQRARAARLMERLAS